MIRGQRAKLNLFEDNDFLTQQQIDEIIPPFDIDKEMEEVLRLEAEYAASLND